MKIIFKIHWRDDKPLNEMDRNELIIKWADELIFHSDHLGKIQTDSFNPALTAETFVHSDILAIRQEAESRLGNISGDLDRRNKWLIDFREGVLNHLLSHKYIKDPIAGDDIWRTSEKGDLAKELGGYFKYQQHRRREINILKNQAKVNNWLIGATFAAAVMPFLAAWIFSTKVYNTNVLPAPVYRPDIRIDSVWLHQQVDAALQKIKSNPDTGIQLRLQQTK